MTDNKFKAHYINNSQFSNAVVEYVKKLNEARENDDTLPKVPEYVARCFLEIAENLSHKANFIGYTYREEMVMDAVENCLKAIENYDINAATRSGKPNAFSYFTQITWYAFLRRISKEKKQQNIKMKYLMQSSLDIFVDNDDDNNSTSVVNSYLDQLKSRIESVKEKDEEIKEFIKKEKVRKNTLADSNLEGFLL